MEDPIQITGLSKLINHSKVDTEVDPSKLESEILGKISELDVIPETDPVEEFKRTMIELADNTGIQIDDDSLLDVADVPEAPSAPSGYATDGFGVPEPMYSQPYPDPPRLIPKLSSMRANTTSFYDNPVSAPAPAKYIQPPPLQKNIQPKPLYAAPRTAPRSSLRDTMQVYSGKMQLSVEQEHDEDQKALLLDDIFELCSELKSEGVDLSRIPAYEQAAMMTLPDVMKLHKIVLRKYNRSRSNTFGSSIIMMIAKGAEHVFDGKKKYGPFAPDLTGWSNTVRPKLQRMRYETSTVVSNAMEFLNMGPVSRMAIELVPSAFLYSTDRSSRRAANEPTDAEFASALSDLQQYE